MNSVPQSETGVNPQLARWGGFITHCAERVGSSEDIADRIQAGFVALLEHQKLPESDVAFRIRTAVAIPEGREIPFSALARHYDDGDEEGVEAFYAEEQVEGDGDPETILEGIQEAIAEAACLDLEAIVDHEMGKAIAMGEEGKERATLIAKAWQEYLDTRLQPAKEPTPVWNMEPTTGESRGAWEMLAEDEDEELLLRSADDDLEHMTAKPAVINMRLGRPLTMPNEGRPSHALDTEPELRPDMEGWPRGVWKAQRDTWGTADWYATMFGIWKTIAPRNETEQAWVLRYFASHLMKNGLVTRREQFYGPAVYLLNLPREWLDIEIQEEAFGEDAIGAAEGEFGHFAQILYGIDYEGWEQEEVPEMEWPSESGLLDTIESHGSRPWETAVFIRAVVSAAENGGTYAEAQSAGWDAWRAARLSRPAVRTYLRKEAEGLSQENASWAASNVDKFTREVGGKIVGLLPSGLKVNGKGTLVVTWDWEKAIPNANRVHVERGKEDAFIAACKNLGGKAAIFAGAFASALSYRR